MAGGAVHLLNGVGVKSVIIQADVRHVTGGADRDGIMPGQFRRGGDGLARRILDMCRGPTVATGARHGGRGAGYLRSQPVRGHRESTVEALVTIQAGRIFDDLGSLRRSALIQR